MIIQAPFLQPANGVEDTPSLPYYLYAIYFFGFLIVDIKSLIGIALWALGSCCLVSFCGILYFPSMQCYTFILAKESLDDGMVVMTVSVCLHVLILLHSSHTQNWNSIDHCPLLNIVHAPKFIATNIHVPMQSSSGDTRRPYWLLPSFT